MKVDAPIARARNSSLVLRKVWHERQISRAELARQTRLSRSTVSDIVAELLLSGMVREVGAGTSTGGRRPILIEFQDDSYSVLGLDIGASHVGMVRMNLRGDVSHWESLQFDARNDPDGALLLVDRLLDSATRSGSAPVLGIGCSVPCPVDPEHPDQLSTIVLPRWSHVRLESVLQKRLDVPVFIDNDANCGVVAEHWWGAGLGHDDLTYIKLATGVGAGFILGGKVYRGSKGVAGELGHIVVDPDGAVCECGLRGCLVTRIGSRAIVASTKRRAEQHSVHPLATQDLQIGQVIDATIGGDNVAQSVVAQAGADLGRTIASLLNLLNPSVVVLGGGLTRAGSALVEPMKSALRGRASTPTRQDAEIVVSPLGQPGIALGAATMVLAEALSNQAMFPVLTHMRSVLQ